MERSRSPVMSGAMTVIFSPEGHVRGMLAFERALALAEARYGVIPAESARAIAAACEENALDAQTIFAEAAEAGAPTIPFVRELTRAVANGHGRYVHWGATSQDAIDTAFMLQAREGLDLLTGLLRDIAARCADLAEEHRLTPMAGRTLQQQALPLTFGLKAARWLSAVTRHIARLVDLRGSLAVQFGGAVGTHASIGDAGLAVMEGIAEELGLEVPDLPWHTERDRIVDLAAVVGAVAGTMGKLAGDVLLLAQTEVGEVSEGVVAGRGGSSTMPHKQNPVDATFARSAARLAVGTLPVLFASMEQEHERAAGAWQAEWESLPQLFIFTAAAVERVHRLLAGLRIDADRMRANLDLSNGLILAESLSMTLARYIGRPEAYALVKAASVRVREQVLSLHEVALEDDAIRAVLSPEQISTALDPAAYLGSTETLIDRALARYREMTLTS